MSQRAAAFFRAWGFEQQFLYRADQTATRRPSGLHTGLSTIRPQT
jgi:hypothetical protein